MIEIYKLMEIIDANKENIKEGDYLIICNILKDAYGREGNKNRMFEFINKVYTKHNYKSIRNDLDFLNNLSYAIWKYKKDKKHNELISIIINSPKEEQLKLCEIIKNNILKNDCGYMDYLGYRYFSLKFLFFNNNNCRLSFIKSRLKTNERFLKYIKEEFKPPYFHINEEYEEYLEYED